MMQSLGISQSAIATRTGLTLSQVQYAASHPASPKKRSGRRPALTEAQVEDLIAFITASKEGRRMPYCKLPQALGFTVGEYCIRHTLRKLGYHRCVAWPKPPISEKNRLLRLEWSHEHRDWTPSQWAQELWSGETWVSPGRHTKTWVTRKPGEELDPACIVEKDQRKAGWMFWGCFSGQAGKGPCVFWEKEWGSVNATSYCERVVPLVDDWIRLHPGHRFMQDTALAYHSKLTAADFNERGVEDSSWPPYSPDLNPIETVWNWMKNWIQDNYSQEHMSYDMLRRVVRESWEAVPGWYLNDLVASMPARCEAVIAADGMHTKY